MGYCMCPDGRGRTARAVWDICVTLVSVERRCLVVQRRLSLVSVVHRTAPLLMLAAASLATPAQAREEEPLADRPLPCPLDAPVRVASEKTLGGFDLLANCRVEDVIVAPAPTKIAGPVFDSQRVEVIPGPDDKLDGNAKPKLRQAVERRGRRTKPERQPVPGGAVVQMVTLSSGTRVARVSPKVQMEELPVVDFGAPIDVAATDPVRSGVAQAMGLGPRSYSSPYDGLILAAAQRHGVDPLFVHAVVHQESRYRPNALSWAGARGLMQLMPGTAAMMGVRDPNQLWDPATNIEAGARLLARLNQRFPGRPDLVLAAYNAGEGAVTKYGYTVPPYAETRAYVGLVQAHYRRLVAEIGLASAR